MQPWEILDKFTGHLRDVLARAIAVATEVGSPNITPVHILYSLSIQKGSVAHEILQKEKITTDTLQTYLISAPRPIRKDSSSVPTAVIPELAPNAKQALEKAMLIAHDYEHTHVGTEHLLSGLVSIQDDGIKTILNDAQVSVKKIQRHADNILQSISRFPDLDEVDEIILETDAEATAKTLIPLEEKTAQKNQNKKRRRLLDYFATELTDTEIQKHIDPVIGREKEIERVIHVLSRRTKNNPVLLGDPGVGKTAIIEGLAKKIINQDVPDVLLSKRLYQLDIGMLIAGTIYRGEFESRIKQIIDEVIEDPNIILFIDEVHTIVGTGSTQGSMDAANILKPALARGQIHCIGATTANEYKKYIESDSALERRFQAVYVDEPTREKAYAILQGIKGYYEEFHNVKITKQAIREAVELSVRFIQNAKLPDKAIDLIDEASASVRVRNSHDKTTRKLHELRRRIQETRNKKEEAVYDERFDNALELKKQEKNLLRQLNITKQETDTLTHTIPRITALDIARVVSRITDLPVDHILHRGQQLYENLEQNLERFIIGQNKALSLVAGRLRVAAAGLHETRRPFASFLFIGPPGVGKTETAKRLAHILYPSRTGLLRLDMSEFSESYGVSKLLGAPAGYIGYRESTPILDKLQHQPHSIVLFDNIEKAHSDITRLLLQILEEGEITNATGKTISFRQAIVIMTMVTEKRLFNIEGLGFTEQELKKDESLPGGVQTLLKEELGDELLGRVDAIVPFQSLTEENLRNIIQLHLKQLNHRLKKRQKTLVVTDEVVEHFIRSIHDEHGARMIRNLIAHKLTSPLTGELSKKSKQTITAYVENGEIVVQ